jgi:deoxyribodipyrimidine photo-lyase
MLISAVFPEERGEEMIQNERIARLNGAARTGRGAYAVYWMQRSQRAEWNHALEHCIERANELELVPVVLFVLTPDYPGANLRHYRFMAAGLAETARRLEQRGIPLVILRGNPAGEVLRFCEDAALCVTDAAYTRQPRRWRKELADRLSIPLYQVETDTVVPVAAASPKEEYTAGTFRPKLHRQLPAYLRPLTPREPRRRADPEAFGGLAAERLPELVGRMGIDETAGPVKSTPGGAEAAGELLDRFIAEKLDRYAEEGNDPALQGGSGLSPYLHFGQISPLEIALRVLETDSPGKEEFLEQLVVRRELAFNFTWYNPGYDDFSALPEWARTTLWAHAEDVRERIYSPEELESARTGDPYWNAAQRELMLTGEMHGYMRMYWGKKILEWSATPEEGFLRALRLNDRYALDGRDPNGYAGVAWCFGKHDRAWKEREVFGKVRYMNDRGLRRKFDIDRYVERITAL